MISTDNSLPEEAPPPAAPADAPAVADAPPVEAQAVSEPAAADAAAETAAAPDAAPATPAAPDLSPAATGARLAELFPALFVGPDGKGTWRAIKLRIHADIQARAPGQFSKRTLGIFFSRYTTTTPYLKALAAPGAQRHDLDGQPAGEIAEEHRVLAAEEVARRQAIAAERRAAFRKPPPRAAQATIENEAPAPREPRAPRESGHDGRRDSAPRRGPPGPRPTARHDAPARRDARPSTHSEPPAPQAALPADPAQRERALLLRAFESSPLSRANFCALKRISEAELDAALAQARVERG